MEFSEDSFRNETDKPETESERTFMYDGPGMAYDPNHSNPMMAAFDSIKNMKPEDSAKLWEYAQSMCTGKAAEPAESMTCSACGSGMRPDAEFCPRCGAAKKTL